MRDTDVLSVYVWWMWTKTNNDGFVSTNAGHGCIKYVWSGGCGQRKTMIGSCRLMRDIDVLSMYGLVDVDREKQ